MELPITVRLSRGLSNGDTLIVRGKPTGRNAWFAISLMKDMQALSSRFDNPNHSNIIALQIQPRFDERLIVLNTFNRNWGAEVRNSGFPLHADTKNEIKIQCSFNTYIVHINGVHFATYTHRVNSTMANYLNIYGDLDLHEIIFA